VTSHCEKPDCDRPQDIAVAVPTISITAPVNATVSTNSGYMRRQSNCR
jgi:hypothetical protein